MPPKRTKSALSSNKNGSQWENTLATAPFCEKDVWRASVLVVNSNSTKEIPIIQSLVDSINGGTRKLFTSINKQQLYSQINVKAGVKPVKGKEIKENVVAVNQYPELFERCRPYLEGTATGVASVGELPVSLQALLIKSQLLSAKQKDIARREVELRPDTGRLSKPTSATDKKGKGKDRAKSAKKGGKGAQEAQKATKLKKRGEEDDDIKFIDDEPKDGPDHYIIISGFSSSARLISALADICIQVDSIVRCHDDKLVDAASPTNENIATELQEEMIHIDKQLTSFWMSIPNILKIDNRLNNINLSTFKAICIPPEVSVEQTASYNRKLYDVFAIEIYNLNKSKRQWKHFLDNLKLIHIPDMIPENVIGFQRNDMRKYKSLISSIPMQSASIPLIMNCMLEQVELNVNSSRKIKKEKKIRREDGLNPKIADDLMKMVTKLSLNEEQRKLLAQDFEIKQEQPVTDNSPVLINFNDNINLRLHDTKPLNDFNPIAAEINMLKSMPAHDLIKYNQKSLTRRQERQSTAAFTELLSYINISSNLSKAELEHTLTSFAFECQPLRKDKHNTIPRDTFSNPWDYPYPFYEKIRTLTPNKERKVRKGQHNNNEQNRCETSESGWVMGDDDLISLAESARRNEYQSEKDKVDTKSKRDNSSRPKSANSTDPTKSCVSDSASKKYGEINEQRSRVLDDWCFTEKLNNQNLQQNINKALDLLPVADVYQRKSDGNLLVTLHNPYNQQTLSNDETFTTYLHSDIGYRNYDENVSVLLKDWTCEQEAKYQLELSTKEAEKLKLEKEKEARATSAEILDSARGKKDRSKSPRNRTPKKNSSRPSSSERSSTSNLIRHGSLKHAAIEAEHKKAEDAEKEAAKVTRSASAKKDRSSAKGKRTISQTSQVITSSPQETVDREPLPRIHWPFIGYDLGDKLAHVTGMNSNLFPSDGSMISIKKNCFVKGRTSLTTSIHKDGHVISLHLLDPNTQYINEIEEVTYEFASFTATMSDGLTLSYSHPKAKPTVPVATTIATTNDASEIATTYRCDMPSTITNIDSQKITKPTASDQKSIIAPASILEKNATETVCTSVNTHRDEILLPLHEQCDKFHISTPDGLVVSYHPEKVYRITKEDQTGYVVKQRYASSVRGLHACEVNRPIGEKSRVITAKGTVIKTMTNGITEILFANGTTTILELIKTVAAEIPETKSEPEEIVEKTKKNKKTKKSGDKRLNCDTPVIDDEDINATEPCPTYIKQWRTTMPNGDVIISRYEDGKKMDNLTMKMQQSSDPSTNRTLFTREDGVLLVTDPSGKIISKHADGTKITTFFRDVTSTVISSANTERVKMNEQEGGIQINDLDREMPPPPTEEEITEKVMFVLVECEGFASCLFNTRNGDSRTQFGNGSMLALGIDGSSTLYHESGGSIRLYDRGTLSYFPKNESSFQTFILKTSDSVIFETKDDDGNLFKITNQGEALVERTNEIEQNKLTIYKNHSPRFFVVEPSGSGYELLRYQDIEDYINECEIDESTAILTDPLTDHPNVTGITILRKSESVPNSKKWFVPLQSEQLIPEGLISRDLKTLPIKEEVKPGPSIGMNIGRGLTIGAVTKDPAAGKARIKCPKVLEMRQLLQYKTVNQETRHNLESSLRSYCEAVLEREHFDSQMIYPSDADSRLSKANEKITPTKDIIEGDMSAVFERAMRPQQVTPPTKAHLPSQSAKSEMREEQQRLVKEARTMLNKNSIPSYFESDIGKAFLRSLNMPNMTELSRDLAHSLNSSENNPTNQIDLNNAMCKSIQSTESGVTSISEEVKQSDTLTESGSPSNDGRTRPFNPTPSHASGLGSPRPIRPNNPTPAQSMKQPTHRPSGPTPKESNASILEHPEVLEQKNKNDLNLPKYLSASRNNPIENTKFKRVEKPVRRKVNTSIMAANDESGSKIEAMRGFLLLPTILDFGLLCEGSTYAIRLQLRNNGADSCRFKVVQPPPSTGIKVIYKVGLVAAGMVSELNVIIFAIASGLTSGQKGIGQIDHSLKIISEIETLSIPITATVMTTYDYGTLVNQKLPSNVRLLSTKPPQSVIRPRYKDHSIGVV